MRRNLINWLILAGCIIITGCVSGNAVREMRYPGIEPAVAMGSGVRHSVLLISDIDSGSDLLSPRIQKAVRYRSPSPETVISRDNDAEQTKSFWNINIVEDDDSVELGNNAQFIIHNTELSNHTEQENKNEVHFDKLTEQNHSVIPTETNEVSAAEKSPTDSVRNNTVRRHIPKMSSRPRAPVPARRDLIQIKKNRTLGAVFSTIMNSEL